MPSPNHCWSESCDADNISDLIHRIPPLQLDSPEFTFGHLNNLISDLRPRSICFPDSRKESGHGKYFSDPCTH